MTPPQIRLCTHPALSAHSQNPPNSGLTPHFPLLFHSLSPEPCEHMKAINSSICLISRSLPKYKARLIFNYFYLVLSFTLGAYWGLVGCCCWSSSQRVWCCNKGLYGTHQNREAPSRYSCHARLNSQYIYKQCHVCNPAFCT
jgi:hypothetical protein